MPESPPQLRVRDCLAPRQLLPGLLDGLALLLGLVIPWSFHQGSQGGVRRHLQGGQDPFGRRQVGLGELVD
jgi:hypothetical protein